MNQISNVQSRVVSNKTWNILGVSPSISPNKDIPSKTNIESQNGRFEFECSVSLPKGMTFRFHLGCLELYTVSCHSSYCNYWPGQHRHQKHLKSRHSSHLLLKIWSQTIQKLNAELKSWIQPYQYHVTILKTFHEGLCPVFHRKCHGQVRTPLMICCTGGWSYHVIILLIEKKGEAAGKSCYKVGIRLSKCKGGGRILPQIIPLPQEWAFKLK